MKSEIRIFSPVIVCSEMNGGQPDPLWAFKIAGFDGDGVMDFASAVTSGQIVVMKGICR